MAVWTVQYLYLNLFSIQPPRNVSIIQKCKTWRLNRRPERPFLVRAQFGFLRLLFASSILLHHRKASPNAAFNYKGLFSLFWHFGKDWRSDAFHSISILRSCNYLTFISFLHYTSILQYVVVRSGSSGWDHRADWYGSSFKYTNSSCGSFGSCSMVCCWITDIYKSIPH